MFVFLAFSLLQFDGGLHWGPFTLKLSLLLDEKESSKVGLFLSTSHILPHYDSTRLAVGSAEAFIRPLCSKSKHLYQPHVELPKRSSNHQTPDTGLSTTSRSRLGSAPSDFNNTSA